MKKLLLFLSIILLAGCEQDKNTINPSSIDSYSNINQSYKPIKIGNHTWIQENVYNGYIYIHDPDCKCIQAKINTAINESKSNKPLQ